MSWIPFQEYHTLHLHLQPLLHLQPALRKRDIRAMYPVYTHHRIKYGAIDVESPQNWSSNKYIFHQN